jgi:hypothetical protein
MLEPQVMKNRYPFLGLILALGLIGCSQFNPVPREEVEANLAPMLRVERRADQVKYYSEMLLRMEGLSRESAQKLKSTHDIYYVYYLAASVYLARGNVESYLAHLKQAEKELDAMEGILKRDLSRLSELEREKKERVFRSGL